jgi:hypothetical protein
MGFLDELADAIIETAVKAGHKAVDSILGDAEDTLAKRKNQVGQMRKDLRTKVEEELGPFEADAFQPVNGKGNASVIDAEFIESQPNQSK